MTVKIVVPISGSLLRKGARMKVGPSVTRGSERGPDDTRLPREIRGADLCVGAQQWRELAEALADCPTEDEEIRPEQVVHLGEVNIDPLDPGGPVELLCRAHMG